MGIVSSGNMNGSSLYGSAGYVYAQSCALRPVISFDISQLDTSEITKDGSSISPWEIK